MNTNSKLTNEVLRLHLFNKGWNQSDLAYAIGKTNAAVTEIIQGKRSISPEMAALFAAAFDTDVSYWLALEVDKTPPNSVADTKSRARLLDLAPVREMVRRGWLKKTDSLEELDAELKTFFRVKSLESPPSLSVATRKPGASTENLTPAQRAWCFRVRNMASDLIVSPFNPKALGKCLSKLQSLTTYAPEVRKVTLLLSDYGIRFVVIEPLSGSRIDGAALWLDESNPVIAVSLRFDRIDSFWFTLFHEFSHIRHEDVLSVDIDLTGPDAIFPVAKEPIERRADNDAAKFLVPPDRIKSFIRRVGPLYSKKRIIQFAHSVKVHPGIIVGQLQHVGEISHRANREMLVKIRDRVVSSTLVDGWGNTIE